MTSEAAPVLWSASLPDADGGDIVATPDGGCLVSSRDFLAAVGPTGIVEWLVANDSVRAGAPVLLPKSKLARTEGEGVAIRDAHTGALATRWPESWISALAVSPDGDLVYSRAASGAGSVLLKVAEDATTRWSRPLSQRLPTPPLVHNGLILVADGRLCAFDLSGTPRWTADREGFHSAESISATGEDEINSPLLPLRDDLVAAELRWRTGSGWFLFDIHTGTVTALTAPLPLHQPATPIHGPTTHVAMLGPTERTSNATTTWTLARIDLAGQVIWTHVSEAEPKVLVSDLDERVLVASSPELRRWRDYREWYDFSSECFVRCLNQYGDVEWTWYAPLPLTYRPVVGPTGVLYIGTPGTLWALR